MSSQDFVHILGERGLIHQQAGEALLADLSRRQALCGYIGFDCTADSLHAGSLVQLVCLRWLQKTGNRAIVLIGDATTRIGDPSGKDESRQLLTRETIAGNVRGIRKIFRRFLDFGESAGTGGGVPPALLVHNSDWLDGLDYIGLLRDVGPHFSVNRMLAMDSVRLRLERQQPLSFLEFNYMVLQAIDFRTLNSRYGCNLQIGGSDQWGNIVCGIELVRRLGAARGEEISAPCGLTTPLLVTADGRKMGKSAAGAIWLDPEKLDSFSYWQYWRNVDDGDVCRFLGFFTELPMDEVRRLGALGGRELNEAKKILATCATALVHGQQAADTAAATAESLFEDAGKVASIPVCMLREDILDGGLAVFELAARAGLAESGAGARRLVRAGGLRLNGAVVASETRPVTREDFRSGSAVLVAGRKRHVRVELRPGAGSLAEPAGEPGAAGGRDAGGGGMSPGAGPPGAYPGAGN